MRLIRIILFALIIWVAGLFIFNKQINSYIQDNDTKTDAIIVLTGGRNRIAEAISLLNLGLADKLFISGVQKDVSLNDISAKANVKITTDREIYIDQKSTNTVENAVETMDWIKENHISSIRLVTSNYHIPRSLEEFYSINGKLKIIIHPVYSEKVAKDFWSKSGSLKLIVSEYNKFLYVYIKRRLEKII